MRETEKPHYNKAEAKMKKGRRFSGSTWQSKHALVMSKVDRGEACSR